MTQFPFVSLTKAELEEKAQSKTLCGFFAVRNDDYHSGPGVSSTDIKSLLRSPAHYKEAKAQARRSKAMDFGTALHESIFEDGLFEEKYAVEPPEIGDKTRNPGKKLWEEFKAANSSKTILTLDDIKLLTGMRWAITGNPTAWRLVSESMHELAAYAYDPETGVLRKAKADMALSWGIADLKSCQDARWEAFSRDVRRYKYHVSGAYYLDTFNLALEALALPRVDAFLWLAVESTRPHGVKVHPISDLMLKDGREQVKKALTIFKECSDNCCWPGYSHEIEPCELPELTRRTEDDDQ